MGRAKIHWRYVRITVGLLAGCTSFCDISPDILVCPASTELSYGAARAEWLLRFTRIGAQRSGAIRREHQQATAPFFVSDVNPGFVDEILPLTLSKLNRDWARIRITEYADRSCYPHKGIIDIMGFGCTPRADHGELKDCRS